MPLPMKSGVKSLMLLLSRSKPSKRCRASLAVMADCVGSFLTGVVITVFSLSDFGGWLEATASDVQTHIAARDNAKIQAWFLRYPVRYPCAGMRISFSGTGFALWPRLKRAAPGADFTVSRIKRRELWNIARTGSRRLCLTN